MRAPSTFISELSFDYEPCEIPEHHITGYDLTEIVYVGVEFIADEPVTYSVDLWFENEHYENPPYFTVREGIPRSFFS
jgi:hypothetical protein